MKLRKLVSVLVILALFVVVLAGCSDDRIEYGKDYNFVFYDSEQAKFVSSGATFVLNDDLTYREAILRQNNEYTYLDGRYYMDDKLDLIYLEANDSSVDSFKSKYRRELKAMGYTSSEIEHLILPAITGKGEMFKFNEYLFKLGAINASREGSIDTVNQVEGVYNFNGILDKSSQRMKLKGGEIFLGQIRDNEEIFEKKIGKYEISGDFITIEPIVALEGGPVNKPMRYLLADITLPAKFDDRTNDDGTYKGNGVIKVYKNVKIKVIVGSFYTTKSMVDVM